MKSMTGYGRSQKLIDNRDVTVEIRSVNHRFFEFSARVPRAYGYLESKLKSYLQPMVSRGKVDVAVTVYTVNGNDTKVNINDTLAKGYTDALRSLKEELSLVDDLSLSTIARFSDLFTVQKMTEDEEAVWADVQVVAAEALEKFVRMREEEGGRLVEDVQNRLHTIAGLVTLIEEKSPQTLAAYRERLTTKMQDVLKDHNIDQNRLLLEAAVYAEKIAVDEETVRLRSHLSQFELLLKSDQAVGRKLDFMVQELNRETNTIGSKAQDIDITGYVVDIKGEIEKIREQIQNIE